MPRLLPEIVCRAQSGRVLFQRRLNRPLQPDVLFRFFFIALDQAVLFHPRFDRLVRKTAGQFFRRKGVCKIQEKTPKRPNTNGELTCKNAMDWKLPASCPFSPRVRPYRASPLWNHQAKILARNVVTGASFFVNLSWPLLLLINFWRQDTYLGLC